jgi:hypothetical protein
MCFSLTNAVAIRVSMTETNSDAVLCFECGRPIGPDEPRHVLILGAEDGEEVRITRRCIDCGPSRTEK